MKKRLAALLCAAMLTAALPVLAWADETPTAAPGATGGDGGAAPVAGTADKPIEPRQMSASANRSELHGETTASDFGIAWVTESIDDSLSEQDTYRVVAKQATKKIAFAVTPSGEFADCAKIEVHVKPDSGTAGVAKTFEVTRPSKDAPFNFTSEIFNLGDQTGDNTYNADFLVAIVPSEGGFDEPAPDAASGIDTGAKSPKTGLATGLRYFTTHEGPYLVHCPEGKDRAGFVSALLECYMGATYDEVVADYMVTYYNYYGVTKEAEPAKYDAILRSNIVKTLQTAFGVEDLKTADLKQEATDFFKELGLTDAELTTLTANLSKEYTGGSTEPETKSYVKVTAAPEDWSGTYLIVNEADETSAYVFNGNDAVNGYVSATIANSKITSSTELDAVAVTIEKTTDGYTLKVNGQYIYGTDGKNTLKFTDTAANAVNTITLSETDGVIITSNTSVLRFNAASNQLRFRYYKASTYSDQQAIQLYKLEG